MRLQIAARPRGGQTADEEGRCHGGEHGALLLIGSVSRAPGSCPRLREVNLHE